MLARSRRALRPPCPAWRCALAIEASRCDERASVRPDAADRLRCGTQAGDRLQRLAPLLVVLGAAPSRSARRARRSASGWALRTRSNQAGPSSLSLRVISPMSSSTTHAGSVSIVAAPNSCNHRRIARTVRSVSSGALVERPSAARTIRPARSASGIAMACCSAPTSSPRSSRAPHARSCAARSCVGARRCQPRPEKRREQVVVAVPAPPLIQGHDEQVGGEQVVQQCRRFFDCP